MALTEGSRRNCGNTVTTPRGTYTFHEQEILKSEADELCKKNGGILAPLNTQEEFDAVHKFAYECKKWSVSVPYHVGLYAVDRKTRLFTDCTSWQPETHEKLYRSYLGKGPFFTAYYKTGDKVMTIASSENKKDEVLMRTICFNGANSQVSGASALVQSKEPSNFASTGAVVVGVALVATVVGLGVALFKALRRNRRLTQELPTSSK